MTDKVETTVVDNNTQRFVKRGKNVFSASDRGD